ncbi:hypothetical protein [Chitinophaga sp.]|uniref:hypothetical protein n=1 Tax=Chitinophaga sp. TaxID=1869181 RepID=UPI002F93129C
MKRTLYLLALCILGIATTEFGVIGILPQIAAHFRGTIDRAGWLLSGFALVISINISISISWSTLTIIHGWYL